jgi:hypothetical protein
MHAGNDSQDFGLECCPGMVDRPSFSKGSRYFSEEGLAREAATDFPEARLLSMTYHTTDSCVYDSTALL